MEHPKAAPVPRHKKQAAAIGMPLLSVAALAYEIADLFGGKHC